MKSGLLTLIKLLSFIKICQGYKVGYRDVMMAKEMAETRDHHPRGQEHPHRHHPRGTVAVDASMAGIMDQIFTKDQGNSAEADPLPSMGKFKSVLPSSTSKSKISSKPLSSFEAKSMDATASNESHPRELGSLSATRLVHPKVSVRQDMKTRTSSDTDSHLSFLHERRNMDQETFHKVNTDAKLDAAIESLQDLVNSRVFQPKSSFIKDWESFDNQEQVPEIRVVRSAEEEDEEDMALKEAIESFESVMEAAMSFAHSRPKRSVSAKAYTASSKEVEEYILRQLKESHDSLSRASVRVLDNRYEAKKLLEKSKNILAGLAKAIELKEIDDILEKLGTLPMKKTKVKRSTDDNKVTEKKKMVARGFNSNEYNWLSKEFLLTKKEVDDVKNLSEEEFQLFSESLMEKTDMTSMDGEYTAEDLVSVLKSARQLVPAELEAAAHSIIEVGKHLGGRARTAVDPVVTLVRDTVIPETGRLVNDAVETVPDDVKDWVGEGSRIASQRIDAAVEYAGPKLIELGEVLSEVQEELAETAGDTFDKVAPTIIPALQSVVDALRDTLEVARDAIPPVSERVESLYNSVEDTVTDQVIPAVEPYAYRFGKTLQNDVGPSIQSAVKTSLNAVFTGVPKVINQLSHEAHDAAKVFSGNYKSTLKSINKENVQPKKTMKDL